MDRRRAITRHRMAKQSGGWKGQRGSRHQRGYGAAWVRLRKAILARDGYLCQVCLAAGRPTPATAVDHIKPKAIGGTDDAENLRAICDDCHKAKTTAEGHAAHGREVKAIRRVGLDGYPISE